MSYIIGTGEYVSTWGALRSLLFSNGTNIYPIVPQGFVYYIHNKEFPPTSGEQGYTPFYFTPQSGTLLKCSPYDLGVQPYIYFEPAPYEPHQPTYWNGYITIIGVDHQDFLYMVGKTLTAAATSTTIDASAETYPGQLLQTGTQDWGLGLTGVEKFKLVT